MVELSNGFHGVDMDTEDLSYVNPKHDNEVLTSICNLRKSQKFCDVKLVVDNHEIFGHRAVLAASSGTLFDIFSKGDDSSNMFKLRDVDFQGFSYLLDYMYTGRLTVPAEDVRLVYGIARRLKMETPSRACADFLANTVTSANCLGVRSYINEKCFRDQIDEFIQENINEVVLSEHFFNLPRIQLEVIGADETLLMSCSESRLFELALDWVKYTVDEVKPKLDRLIEKVNVLYLSADNVLRDVKDVDDENLKLDQAVQDYKKLIRRQSGQLQSRESTDQSTTVHTKQNAFHKFNIEPDLPKHEKEWSVVACHRVTEHTFMAVMMLGSQMAALSLHFRIPQNSPYNSSSEGPDSPVHTRSTSHERLASLAPLPSMSTPRCALGIRAVKGKIIACGGYDRGEVMKSAECYDPSTNEWRKLPDMIQARCRFTAAHLDGKLYAIGGSDGHNELSVVECYDPELEKWTSVASLNIARSSPGVAVLHGKIYCVGGSAGQESLKRCEVYDPESNTWTPIASLNTGRFQVCVRAFRNRLYAVGGTDGWNCFNTVEEYNPETNFWEYGSPLNVARRGAGIEAFSGKLYIVGGSDGTRSLKTTETYSIKERKWTFSPSLGTARANVGAAVIGHRLYAVGGFCGKRFLDTMEYFDVEQQEWCSCEPLARSRSGSNVSSDSDSVDSLCNGTNGTDLAMNPAANGGTVEGKVH